MSSCKECQERDRAEIEWMRTELPQSRAEAECEGLKAKILVEESYVLHHSQRADFLKQQRDESRAECEELKVERDRSNSCASFTLKDRDRAFEEAKRDKRLLFDSNGRLLEEKESGLWDLNHPIRAQLAESQTECARMRRGLETMLKAHGCGCESVSEGGWTCPAHELLRLSGGKEYAQRLWKLEAVAEAAEVLSESFDIYFGVKTQLFGETSKTRKTDALEPLRLALAALKEGK